MTGFEDGASMWKGRWSLLQEQRGSREVDTCTYNGRSRPPPAPGRGCHAVCETAAWTTPWFHPWSEEDPVEPHSETEKTSMCCFKREKKIKSVFLKILLMFISPRSGFFSQIRSGMVLLSTKPGSIPLPTTACLPHGPTS